MLRFKRKNLMCIFFSLPSEYFKYSSKLCIQAFLCGSEAEHLKEKEVEICLWSPDSRSWRVKQEQTLWNLL